MNKMMEAPFLVRLIFLFPTMLVMGVVYSLASLCSVKFLGLLLRETAEKLLRERELGLTLKHFYEDSLPELIFIIDFKIKDKQFLKSQIYPARDYSYNIMMELLSTGAIKINRD